MTFPGYPLAGVAGGLRGGSGVLMDESTKASSSRRRVLIVAALASLIAPAAQAARPDAPVTSHEPRATSHEPRLIRLQPQLAAVTLRSPYDTVRLLVDGDYSDGTVRDQSAQAEFVSADPKIADFAQPGLVRARANGRTTLLVRIGGGKSAVACRVAVTVALTPSTPRFLNDVMPILTRAGCNAGACHGANAGKGGFHLSLLGYEPEGDYLALTHFVGARRISPAQPDDSLILRKATYRMPHGGGMRFAPDLPEYRTVRDWIAAGAPRPVAEGKGAEAKIARLVVTPTVRTLAEGQTQRLRVEAVYVDQSRRDVTARTLFTSADGSILEVKPDGVAKVIGPGEGAVVIRYGGLFAVARIVAPFGLVKAAVGLAASSGVPARLATSRGAASRALPAHAEPRRARKSELQCGCNPCAALIMQL